MKRFPIGQLVALGALAAMSGLAFGGVFPLSGIVVPVLLGASVPCLLAVAVRVRPHPHLAISVALNLVFLLLMAGMVVFPKTVNAGIIPTRSTVDAVVDGARSGWADILSSTVPVAPRPAGLFLPFVLTWSAAFISAEMACRSRRVFVVLLPSVLVATVAALFSAGASGTWGAGAVVYVACAAVFLAIRSSSFIADRRPFDLREQVPVGDEVVDNADVVKALRRQRVVVAVPFVLAVAIVAVPLARVLPFVDGQHQVLFRDHYQIPIAHPDTVNPLSQIAGQPIDDTVRYRVTFNTDAPAVARLRLAVLDRYDGIQWSSSAEHVTTGSSIAPSDSPVSRARRVDQTFTTVAPDTAWLPALDRPTQLDVSANTEVQVDPVTGVLVTPEGPTGGLTYRVSSLVSEYEMADLVSAGIGTGDSARRATSAGNLLPPDLADLRARVAGTAASPFQQLARLLAYFQNDERVNIGKKFVVDPAAPNGFTAGHLLQFLKEDGPNPTHAGRPEMFASAFATLAQAEGFPARVVTGYVLESPEAKVIHDLHAGDETAWPEVLLQGFGWVAFDPTPHGDEESSLLTVEEQQLDAAISTSVDQSINQPEARPGENPNLAPAVLAPALDDDHRRTSSLVALAIASLLALLLIAMPWIRKARRRARRRRDPDPATAVAGAWQEAMDRLLEFDIEDPTHLTTREASLVVADEFGEEAVVPLRRMGVLVNAALHDRQLPPSTWSKEAWEQSDAFARSVRRSQSRRRRFNAAFDRRPLEGDDRD